VNLGLFDIATPARSEGFSGERNETPARHVRDRPLPTYARPMPDNNEIVSVERVIAAPADRIFELLAEPARHHDIDGSGTVRDAKESTERLELGAKFGMKMHLGVNYSMVNEIIEFDDGKRIAWQTRPGDGWQSRVFGGRIWRYELAPSGDGTLVRETWDISQEKGPVKYLLRTGRSREHTRDAMEKTLVNIAGLTEGN
jgi:uncharacterized protein YndB with AHSA1/START domain